MDMLGISISTMDTLIRNKVIKYIKLGKRLVRVNEYDVMDYVKSCEVTNDWETKTKKEDIKNELHTWFNDNNMYVSTEGVERLIGILNRNKLLHDE